MKVLETIQETKGKIFSVEFTKKDGSIRKMNCRLNVKKGTNGNGLKFDPIKKGLLPVFDMQNNGFRMINLKTIIKINGNEIK